MTGLLDQSCEAFLSAPFERDGWHKALTLFAESTASSRAHLLAVGDSDAIQFNCLSDPPSESWDAHFLQIDGGNPKINWRVALAERPMSILFEDDYDRARANMACSDYDDFISHYDMMNGCQTTLHKTSSRFFGLATLRTHKDGRTTEDDRKRFSALAPAALSAIRLQYALDHQADQVAKGALEGLNTPAFICDDSGKLSAWTQQADEFLSMSADLAMTHRRLKCRNMRDDANLQRALQSIVQGPLAHHRVKLWIGELGAPNSGAILEIYKLPKDIGSFDFAPKMVVVVNRPEQLNYENIPLLRDIFNLTHAEAEIAIQIANGTERSIIALARGSSAGTVHAHLKSIFRKMDIGRETELASKVHTFLKSYSV